MQNATKRIALCINIAMTVKNKAIINKPVIYKAVLHSMAMLKTLAMWIKLNNLNKKEIVQNLI